MYCYAGTDSTQGIVWETKMADCGMVISCREEVAEEVKPLRYWCHNEHTIR